MNSRRRLDVRGRICLIEETLSDGSLVYDVTIMGSRGGTVVAFHMDDLDPAMDLFRDLSALGLTIYEDDPI